MQKQLPERRARGSGRDGRDAARAVLFLVKLYILRMSTTLIASVSGIRGIFGNGLDPEVLARYAGAYGAWCLRRAAAAGRDPVVVVGRDARVSGEVCASIVITTLRSAGIDVVDTGLATTPTVEMAVTALGASGGIVLSASHNPPEWNALKLLNEKGEFLSPEEGKEVLHLAESGKADVAPRDSLGGYRQEDFLAYHIDRILALEYINVEAIARKNFSVVIDAVNSVGGIALPALLKRLGVRDERIHCLHCEPTGLFAHPAEPLQEHLSELMETVASMDADAGFAVDPDADRLALVADGGTYMGEELTQVIAADFIWRIRPGPFVTNLSSSRAIDDVAASFGQQVFRSPVGEIHVVKKMQEAGAVLGGEGNGGVILPDLHYGRDALVGAALILQHMANRSESLSAMKARLPKYVLSKNKASVGEHDPGTLLAALAERYQGYDTNTIDGFKSTSGTHGCTCVNPIRNPLSGFMPKRPRRSVPQHWLPGSLPKSKRRQTIAPFRVVEQYSWRAVAERTVRFYEELL